MEGHFLGVWGIMGKVLKGREKLFFQGIENDSMWLDNRVLGERWGC